MESVLKLDNINFFDFLFPVMQTGINPAITNSPASFTHFSCRAPNAERRMPNAERRIPNTVHRTPYTLNPIPLL